MDLPPDKAKVLKGYDDERKWEIVCDQVCTDLCHVFYELANVFKPQTKNDLVE